MNNQNITKIAAAATILLLLACGIFYFCCPETVDYLSAINKNTVGGYVSFREKYPESSYWPGLDQRKSQLEDAYFSYRREKNTLEAYDEFLFAFPHDKYTSEANRLRDSIIQWQSDWEKYGKNSLDNGSMPYEKHFGKPHKYRKDSNSDIIVKAPISFDVVTVLRKNDEHGEVVSHAYIKADSTYTFTVDNGKYQAFFYIGRGWHPEKMMSDDLVGGFLQFETFSKDDPVTLMDEVFAYKLSMRQKKSSSWWEIFGR